MKQLLILVFLVNMALAAFGQDEIQKVDWILDHAVIEFAGGIGFFSAGAGYEDRVPNLQTDFQIGYLPKTFAPESDFWIFTAKGTYTFWNEDYENFHFEPIRAGLHINVSTGDELFLNSSLAEEYPKNYYWWSSAIRLNLFIGSEISYRFDDDKKLSAFYELGTNDLYMASYFHRKNHETLPLGDILVLGIGLKYSLK